MATDVSSVRRGSGAASETVIDPVNVGFFPHDGTFKYHKVTKFPGADGRGRIMVVIQHDIREILFLQDVLLQLVCEMGL